MKTKFLIIFVLLFAFYYYADSQINYTVNINASGLSINTATATDGNTYSNVNISKLFSLSDTGKPALPLEYIKFYIPAGKDVDSISFTTSSATTYNLTAKVFPVQKPIITSMSYTSPGFTKPDSVIYNSIAAFPSQMVKLVHNGYFDVNNRIITIAVTPFQYYPLMNKLDFYSSISITVTLKQSSINPVNTVKNRSQYIKAMYADILKSMVVNPQDIPASGAMTSSVMHASSNYTLVPYDYIIITDTSFVSSFASFMDWKKRKGINIGIISKQYIYNHYYSSGGDILFSQYHIQDTSGCVRQFLYDAYQNGLAWALLAGDQSNMAVRKGSPTFNDRNYADDPETDMYFEDFTSNWNATNNGLYGQQGTPPYGDYTTWQYPQIFVGRLLCSTTSQITNWTNHVLAYEQNPGNGSYSYLTNVFSVKADNINAETVSSYLTNFTDSIWGEYANGSSTYDTTGKITSSLDSGQYGKTKASEVIAHMNNYPCGFYGWFCHGGTGDGSGCPSSDSASNISTMTSGEYVGNNPSIAWTLTSQQPRTYCHLGNSSNNYDNYYIVYEPNKGLDALTNDNYPSILWSLSCNVTPYSMTSGKGLGGVMNCGEAFTTLQHTGGAAFLGNTRDGSEPSTMTIFQKYLYEMAGGENSTNGYSFYHLGVAEETAKYWTGSFFYNYSHNLIGCPETEMWTASPQTLSVTTTPTDLTPFVNYSITVTVNTIVTSGNSVTICLYKNNDIFTTYTATSDGVHQISNTFPNVDPASAGTLNVTVTSHNYIPYQGTIPVD